MSFIYRVRLFILKILIGKSPVMANMTIKGQATVNGSGGAIFNNTILN